MADPVGIDVRKNTAGPALRALLERVGDLRAPLTEIGRDLKAASNRRFRGGAGPFHGTGNVHVWKPLRPATVERRRKHSSKPLVDRGNLLKSVQSKVVGGNELHVGTNHEIAPGVSPAILQLGGLPSMAPGPAGIPNREFLGIDRDDRIKMEFVAAAYLGKPVKS